MIPDPTPFDPRHAVERPDLTLRYRQCREPGQSPSVSSQVDELAGHHAFSSDSRILDFGCGQGRFAIGLILSQTPFGEYHGIDTDAMSIEWSRRWLASAHENLHFHHVPAHNARYNLKAEGRRALPFADASFHVAFLNSVFSHMLVPDVQFYLGELRRVLLPGGVVYMTAFIEENVPSVDENPPGYLGRESRGRLHRVRYERGFFDDLVRDAELDLAAFVHRGIKRTSQSVVVARRRDDG